MTNSPQNYQLKILSQSENLEIIREFVSKIAAKAGFGGDDLNKIELAIDEACANVIKHAYDQTNTTALIHLLIQLDYEKLTVIVADEGKGFDVHKIKALDIKEYLAEMRVGGLGIYLIKHLMDDVEFKIKPGERNEVKMTKYYTTQDGAKLKRETLNNQKP